MDIATMRARVRRDLQDEGSPTRFSDDELDRAINRAVTEFSKYLPYAQTSTITTVDNRDEIDISDLTDLIAVYRVEFPIGNMPRTYERFEVYGEIVRLLESVGDGEDCCVYWGSVHTLDESSSTIPVHLEDLVALGASGYAIMSISQAKIDVNNPGGSRVDYNYQQWGVNRLNEFQKGLNKLRSNVNKLRTSQLYNAD
jgi:hypothetical protein